MENTAPSAEGALHVILNYRPLGLVRARTRYIGADAIGLDTGLISLADDSEVEITFSCRQDNRNRVHRLAAQVARSESGTTHLMLRPGDDDAHRALAGLRSA